MRKKNIIFMKELETRGYELGKIFQTKDFKNTKDELENFKKLNILEDYLIFPFELVNRNSNIFQPEKGYHAIYMKPVNPEQKYCLENSSIKGLVIQTGIKTERNLTGIRICNK